MNPLLKLIKTWSVHVSYNRFSHTICVFHPKSKELEYVAVDLNHVVGKFIVRDKTVFYVFTYNSSIDNSLKVLSFEDEKDAMLLLDIINAKLVNKYRKNWIRIIVLLIILLIIDRNIPNSTDIAVPVNKNLTAEEIYKMGVSSGMSEQELNALRQVLKDREVQQNTQNQVDQQPQVQLTPTVPSDGSTQYHDNQSNAQTDGDTVANILSGGAVTQP